MNKTAAKHFSFAAVLIYAVCTWSGLHRRAEPDDGFRGDFDCGAVAEVTARARGLLANHERAEALYHDLVACAQRLRCDVDKGIYRLLGVNFGDVGLFGNGVD